MIQLRETLKEKLREFESGDFIPQRVVDELARARGELDIERAKTKQLIEEMENVKRGSIAVIKYIKSQHGTEGGQSAITDKLASEMANRETLELKMIQLEEVVAAYKEKIEIVGWCHRGPAGAQVSSVDVSWEPYRQESGHFEIRYGR